MVRGQGRCRKGEQSQYFLLDREIFGDILLLKILISQYFAKRLIPENNILLSKKGFYNDK